MVDSREFEKKVLLDESKLHPINFFYYLFSFIFFIKIDAILNGLNWKLKFLSRRPPILSRFWPKCSNLGTTNEEPGHRPTQWIRTCKNIRYELNYLMDVNGIRFLVFRNGFYLFWPRPHSRQAVEQKKSNLFFIWFYKITSGLIWYAFRPNLWGSVTRIVPFCTTQSTAIIITKPVAKLTRAATAAAIMKPRSL